MCRVQADGTLSYLELLKKDGSVSLHDNSRNV